MDWIHDSRWMCLLTALLIHHKRIKKCQKTQADSQRHALFIKMYEFTVKQLWYSTASVGARSHVSAVVVASVVAVVYWHHICFRSVTAPALRPHKAVSVWRPGQQQHIAEAYSCFPQSVEYNQSSCILDSRSLLVCRYTAIWVIVRRGR